MSVAQRATECVTHTRNGSFGSEVNVILKATLPAFLSAIVPVLLQVTTLRLPEAFFLLGPVYSKDAREPQSNTPEVRGGGAPRRKRGHRWTIGTPYV
jgi:hypothetical protein